MLIRRNRLIPPDECCRSALGLERAPRTMGMGMGVELGGSPPPWTPAALSPTLWLGPASAAGRVTYAEQPTIPGAGWSGASWAGSGLGPYTHTAGATTDLVNAVLIVGNRYLITYVVSGRSAGTVTCKAGTTAGTARSADGTYTDELSCAGSTSCIFTPSSDFDGSVTIVGVVNRSASSLTPAIGAALTQATPTAMPWKPTDADAIRFDGVADTMSIGGALSTWKLLHDGSGVTVFIAVKRTNYNDYVLSTSNATTTAHGVSLRRSANPGTAELTIHNGSGTEVCTITQSGFTIDAPHILEYSLSAADGADLAVDGVSTPSALTGSCSASNPSFAPHLMARPSGGWLAGDLYDIIVVPRRLAQTDPERVKCRQYLAAAYGVTL